MKKAVVTVTQRDCRRDTFRCGGKGGQNVQKRDTGVRFTHEPSGAVGECREERTQSQNERVAWRRMAEHPKFKLWSNLQLHMVEQGFRDVEAKVDAAMANESDFKIETEVERCMGHEDFCDKTTP